MNKKNIILVLSVSSLLSFSMSAASGDDISIFTPISKDIPTEAYRGRWVVEEQSRGGDQLVYRRLPDLRGLWYTDDGKITTSDGIHTCAIPFGFSYLEHTWYNRIRACIYKHEGITVLGAMAFAALISYVGTDIYNNKQIETKKVNKKKVMAITVVSTALLLKAFLLSTAPKKFHLYDEDTGESFRIEAGLLAWIFGYTKALAHSEYY